MMKLSPKTANLVVNWTTILGRIAMGLLGLATAYYLVEKLA